jgi:hypothetical protein
MTELISEQQIQEEILFKHIARIFQTGNSFGVRIPASIAARYKFDSPGYALIQAGGEKNNGKTN